MKKWLSYHEHEVLGRALRMEEVRGDGHGTQDRRDSAAGAEAGRQLSSGERVAMRGAGCGGDGGTGFTTV
jgi:hypothetical protein